MKRLMAITTVLAAAAAVGWLGLEACEVTADRREAQRNRSTLPDVELVDLDDAPVAVPNEPDRRRVLVFFTTTCEYCRREIDGLKRSADAFERTDVLLISPEDRESVRRYRRESGLDQIPQFLVLRDTVPTLGSLFRIRRVPTVLAYGADGRLIEAFEGLTPVREILAAAESVP